MMATGGSGRCTGGSDPRSISRPTRLTGAAATLALVLALGTTALGADTEATMTRDVQPGPMGSLWTGPIAVDDLVFFTAVEHGADAMHFSDATRGKQWPDEFGLWVSDGTPGGTLRVHDPSDSPGDVGPYVSPIGEDAGALLFVRRPAPDLESRSTDPPLVPPSLNPWRSDGTPEGTQPILDEAGRLTGIRGDIVAVGDGFYFGGVHQEQGNALFRVESGSSEARLVRAFSPHRTARWGKPWLLAALGERLIFTVDDRIHGQELWVSDGTTEGTQVLADIAPGRASLRLEPGQRESDVAMAIIGDRLFFQARSYESGDLGSWVTDGTPAGTQRLSEALVSFEPSESVQPLVVSAADEAHGSELWLTDGTEAGTELLLDIRPGPVDGFKGWLADALVGQHRYFVADDGLHGPEPWVTDGTAEGTRMILDIEPKAGRGSAPSPVVIAGDRLFFIADDGVHGRQLWVSDGTAERTHPVARLDVTRGHFDASTEFEGDLILGTREGRGSLGLWRSDGTREGTTRLWSGSGRAMAIESDVGMLTFSVAPSRGPSSLWISDGTRGGTAQVTAQKGRRLDLGYRGPVRAGGNIFFYADDGRHGYELWVLPSPG